MTLQKSKIWNVPDVSNRSNKSALKWLYRFRISTLYCLLNIFCKTKYWIQKWWTNCDEGNDYRKGDQRLKMCWTDILTIWCRYQFDDVGDRGSGSSKRHNLLNVTNIQQVSILTWMLKPVSGKSRSNMIVITCPLSSEYWSVLFL